ncbi:MAG: hypothetical protein ABS36_04915 [Acidobacteria bacterium SCN 69-37]|nr:MAG: hypothetical protein ABS36_04915 [Acidobacteria bacterium SCN 69-37]
MALSTAAAAGVLLSAQTSPKRLLVVNASVGFRHPSVDFSDKVVRDLAAQSGDFTVTSTADDPDFPRYAPAQEWELAGAATAGPAGRGGGAPGARRGGGPGAADGPRAGGAGEPGRGRGGPGGAGNAETAEKVRLTLANYLTPEKLKNFDGVFFLTTNGELPMPDLPGFLAWLRDGHGYVGTHAASDTLHQADGYLAMVGGEFAGHGAQETMPVVNDDPRHPATAAFPPSLDIREEFYLFRNYDRSQVHSLLSMTAHPNEKTAGHYPVSWCKPYGEGRVFYTSLGHRLDLWDPAWLGNDGQRANPPEVATAFRQHLVGGIRWALGIVDGDCTPGR